MPLSLHQTLYPPPPLPRESICDRDYISMQLASCTSFSDTQRMLRTEALPDADDAPPCSASPNHDATALSGAPGRPTLIGPLSGLSAFTRVNSISGQNQGAKVIRADPRVDDDTVQKLLLPQRPKGQLTHRPPVSQVK